MKTHQNQHFLPECYLKNFSFDGKGIFVYRKNLEKNVFQQSISNIACAKNFYDIPQKHLLAEHSDKTKYIEKEVFAKGFEPIFSKLLQKIIANCDIWDAQNQIEILNVEERDYFAELIAVQYLRLPQFRNKYWQANKDTQRKRFDIVGSYLEVLNPKFKGKKVSLEFDDNDASIFHSEFILDEKWRYEIQEQLTKKIWIYFYTDKNFYTSDNPILLKQHLPKPSNFVERFGMSGVEIIFPINKNILLTIWDENYFSKLQQHDNTVAIIDKRKEREYNLYQYCFAMNELYSFSDNFHSIENLKLLNDGKDYFHKSSQIKIY